jgi:D-glucosaminate-6-phosphate ammonia-lyase
MVNRVIIPSRQRFAYDQAVRMIGCHIVEIDTREDLDRALDEPVAMVVLLGKNEHLTSVRLEEIAAVVKPGGIPIMVDAASEHLERPSPWLVRGADLVVYSGGKFLRGPQTSGLFEQRGPELGGHHRSAQFEGPVQGWLDGTLVQFSLTSRY